MGQVTALQRSCITLCGIFFFLVENQALTPPTHPPKWKIPLIFFLTLLPLSTPQSPPEGRSPLWPPPPMLEINTTIPQRCQQEAPDTPATSGSPNPTTITSHTTPQFPPQRQGRSPPPLCTNTNTPPQCQQGRTMSSRNPTTTNIVYQHHHLTTVPTKYTNGKWEPPPPPPPQPVDHPKQPPPNPSWKA